MKKLMGLVLAGALVLTLGATSVLASPFGHGIMAQRRDGSCLVNGTGWCQYVDENGDGVCDNCAGKGLCTGNGWCQYVDENGDGVCDNCAGTGLRTGNGQQYLRQTSGGNGWAAGGCHGGYGRHCR
ncbi:hypothetical protein H9X85_06845 [Anaerotignum lactatifermentans]|uniref:Uncharacterized protein n=1 Tax=Anaerotignum lactatifermentans TaxID=160404 RepID=A0ABS2GA13_9FIRM|nr:hypothetical protein [Anaerotignum lactatifermentans]MBM6829356.1 hypothetical protein [Anaerotignum lactatifermentans]MBM6877403.1 hypothetical protein [Anaerotignum lactatifermentans]MBM6950933.1 hypothetical protein [Anaerotignum lactatifermentans]